MTVPVTRTNYTELRDLRNDAVTAHKRDGFER